MPRVGANAGSSVEREGFPSLDAALAKLSASTSGLTADEAARRLAAHGANRLPEDAASHPIALLWRQFRSPLVLILLAAALLSFALGETEEALIVLGIVVASSGLGFQQEYRAGNAIQALRRRLTITCPVTRDGAVVQVPAPDIVAGDVVALFAGGLVPADGIVLEAQELHVDEAALTGESFPVLKAVAVHDAALAPENRVHMGTSVRSGTGVMLVTATGARTDFGGIAEAVGHLEPETSFARGIRRFGLLMTQIMLVMVTLVLVANVLLHRPVLDSLLFAAALAVGMTPELLPAIVTVTLAQGARQLARTGVLVKRLVAIENLGAMDVLCTDKTGTLTTGTVRLERATGPDGAPSPEALRWALLNASLQAGLPNPLDAAITAAGGAVDVSACRKAGEVPYDFERRRLSVLVDGPEGRVLVCKGAVAAVLQCCTSVAAQGGAVPLPADRRAAEEQRAAALGSQGFRVLAIATRSMGAGAGCGIADEAEMTLAGYLVFADPLKPGIAQTIAALGGKGIRLKIISGDNRHVAAHVAEAVGLRRDRLLTGDRIDALGERAFARAASRTDVFAEITPAQKERIVAALRRARHTVGYLGDGINDAPALRAADIGISVDTAVDAARAAADVVLLRPDLNVLLDGVLAGRRAFGNTLKYIAITVSANLGNMLSMAVASLLLPFLPMLATQILLNNSLTDLPMLAISTDRMEPGALDRPRHWDFRALLRAMIGFGLLSSIFDGLTFAVLLFGLGAGESLFQTGWFLESLLTELAVVAVMRSSQRFYRSPPSRLLIATSAAVALIAFVLPYTPLAGAVGFVPLPLPALLAIVGIVLAYVLVSELLKNRIGIPGSAAVRRAAGSPAAGHRPRRARTR